MLENFSSRYYSEKVLEKSRLVEKLRKKIRGENSVADKIQELRIVDD